MSEVAENLDREEIDVVTFREGAQKNILIEDIIALKQKGLTSKQIGVLLNCSKTNINNRLKAYEGHIEGIENYKAHRADVFAIHQRRILGTLSDKDINKMSAAAKITGAAILYDKERIERGHSEAKSGAVNIQINFQGADAKQEIEIKAGEPGESDNV